MDKDEVRNWISPPDYDHTEAEAKHLIHQSDADKVRKFTNVLYFAILPKGQLTPVI